MASDTIVTLALMYVALVWASRLSIEHWRQIERPYIVMFMDQIINRPPIVRAEFAASHDDRCIIPDHELHTEDQDDGRSPEYL